MTNQRIGNILISTGVIILGYEFLLKKFLTSSVKGTNEYGPAPVNPYAGNDDRKTFYSKDGDKENYVKGYDLPDTIERLNPINGKVLLMTLPDTNIFGEKGRAAIEGVVNQVANTISYNGITLDYSFLKDKLAVMDKKYIKA